jgi:hypothetical protein
VGRARTGRDGHNARDMATPKPGEIRCPTCHRSTPPAGFCTQCGSAIPADARARPRGMDRDELQDRIRARRSGGDPYRRGAMPEEQAGGYARYEPDPIDTQARRPDAGPSARQDYLDEGAAAAAGAAAGDITRDRDDWARPAAAAPTPPAAPPPSDEWTPPPSDVPVGDADQPEHVDNFDDAAYEPGDYGYAYEEWNEPRERRNGFGAVAILGFLALGVLALLGGAVLAGIFGAGAGVGQGDATPSPSATAVVTAQPSPSPSSDASGSPGASGSPAASGEPVVFPDGFTAEAQPCIRGSVTAEGCDSNGASNTGSVDIWVGFENGNSNDVVGATLVTPDGQELDGSIDLADIGCRSACNGYTWFPFDGLTPGTYEVRVTRNGELAGTTTFEVS